MTSAQWTYLVADLRTNVIIGDLPLAAGAQISKVLNGSGTLSGTTLPLADPRMKALNVYDMTTPARRAIYAIRDNTPWWGGIIWTRSYDSTADTVSIGCADFWSYFDHRFVLPAITLPPATPTTVAEAVDTINREQCSLAGQLILDAQLFTGGDIGVNWIGGVTDVVRERSYLGYELGTVAQRLRDLANLVDGPDMVFDVGPFDTNGRPKRILITGTPKLGLTGTPYVWEIGGNLVSYVWPSDGTKMTTKTYAIGDGTDVSTLIAVDEDTSRYDDGWPILESSTTHTSVVDFDTLVNYAAADLANNRLPVALPKLRVRGDLPPRFGEFGIGDTAQVIIKDNFFTAGINTTMRVLGIDVSPTETIELVDVTMAPTIEDVM